MSAPKVGDHLDNRYELLRQLGENEASVRFEAAHRYTGRRVVVEFLRGWEGTPEPEVRRTCQAFALGRVRNPHLIEVCDAGVSDGAPYVVTALLAGRSLEGLLAARGTFTPAEVAAVGRQVALALEALHQNGLAHGDVSPANVWMVRSPLGEEQAELRNVQMTYRPLATMSALASRPLRGLSLGPQGPKAAQPLDLHADLGRLGALLFECLVGSVPQGAEELGQPAAPPLLSLRADTPPALAFAVERALASTPRERFLNARDLVGALEATRLAYLPTRFLVGTSQQSLRAVSLPTDPGPKPAAPVPVPVQRPVVSAVEAANLARRKVPRAAYSTPVRLLGHHGVMEGRIEDISTRGILVIAGTPLEVGSVVQLRFAIPGSGAMVQCAGVLRWVRIAPASRRAAMGFEFQATPTELRSAVDIYVSQQQSAPDADG